MIPKLYPANETAFTNHGYGALSDAISCIVTEERNGPYELQMTYPITGLHYSDLALQEIILAHPNFTDDPQPFRIYKITKPLNGIVTIYGQHISYDLSGVLIQSGSAGDVSAAMSVLANAAPGWTINTDKSVTASWKVLEPSSVRSWFGGKAGSILDVYGPGEWHYDKFECSFLTARGRDRGVSVRYAKNLTELSQEINCSNLVKYVLGYYKDVDGNIVSGTLQDTGCLLTDKQMAVDFSADFEEVPTQAALNSRAQQYITANNFTVPTDNITLDFAQLGTLTDRVDLCDTISVYYEALGVSTTAKCIKTTWDVLLERYTEIEVGDAKPTMLETMTQVSEKAASGAINYSQIYNAIEAATSAITGNSGGYVVLHDSNADGHPDELLVMNDPDIATATKVWRWNGGGLGYSSTGYAGTYNLAITANGQIVADAITTGTLSADRIAAGSLAVTKLDNSTQADIAAGASALADAKVYINGHMFYNMAPYFSYPFDDVYNATTNAQGYWKAAPSSTITRLDDGWADVEVDNTSGTANAYATFYPYLMDWVTDDKLTLLVELKDVVKTGNPTLWFSTDNSGSNPQYRKTSSFSNLEDGTLYGTLVKYSYGSNPRTVFTRSGFTVGAGAAIHCKIRISVYPDGYTGYYLPYIGGYSGLRDSIEDSKSMAESAQAAADSATIMEQLVYKSAPNLTATMNPPSGWVTNMAPAQNAWTTVRPPYDSTKQYPVLFVATQRRLVDGTVTCTVPAIDQTTTVIDGGSIISHSITADQIASKSLTIGSLAQAVQTKINNGDSAFSTANNNKDRLDALDGYIHAEGDTLTLGKSDNSFKAQLDSGELGFYQGDDRIAYLSNSKLYITEAEIKANLQVGNYQWIAWSEEGTNKGRMSLKWVASQS